MILIIFYIKWKYYKTINLTRVLEIESKKHLQYLAFRMLLGMNQGLFSFVYFVICDITSILLSFWISDIVILCAHALNKMWSFLHIVSIKTPLKHLFPQRLVFRLRVSSHVPSSAQIELITWYWWYTHASVS